MKKILLTVLLIVPCLFAEAGGFQVVLQGVRTTSMGNASVGQTPRASSIFFNPGAVAMLEDNEVSIGAHYARTRISYSGPFGDGESDNPPSTPVYFYAVFGVGADGAEGTGKKMKIGLGVMTPFGSTVNYKKDWIGQAYLRKLALKAFYIQPTVAYQITPKLGIGAGVDVVMGSMQLIKALPITTSDGTNGQLINGASIEISGKTKMAYGYNVGLYYKPLEKLSIGVSYRSQVDATVESGDVEFTNLPAAASVGKDPAGNLLFPSGAKVSATLPLPAVLSAGIGYYGNEKLTVAADVRYTFWEAYEELKFEFDQPVAGSKESVSKRNYQNSITLSYGAEYKVSDPFSLRLGAYYDFSCVKDGYLTPETPDANTVGLTCGLGYTIGQKFSIDGAFLFVNKGTRSQIAALDANTMSGEFATRAYIPSIALSYKF